MFKSHHLILGVIVILCAKGSCDYFKEKNVSYRELDIYSCKGVILGIYHLSLKRLRACYNI